MVLVYSETPGLFEIQSVNLDENIFVQMPPVTSDYSNFTIVSYIQREARWF